ncbi:MAG: hypothetical protein Q8R92_16900 [Deltaproteobacteria bacterium]|nr:hypothetical protein [Deltaproteobacteria bacterium]
MTRDRWVIVALLVLMLLWNALAGAADEAIPYKFYRAPDKEQACFQVRWTETENVGADGYCGAGSACYLESATGGTDLIVTPKPKDFNDRRALMILGHEVLHLLGGQHD